ncbi:hypothetical protein [Kordia sp.]|uniref:hypothetical protein n=1 Tax=Kordia sp. TaxID=1965332 RepID=UPI003D2AC2D5
MSNNIPLESVGIGTKLEIPILVSSPLANPGKDGNPPIKFSVNPTLELLPPLTQAYYNTVIIEKLDVIYGITLEALIMIPFHSLNDYTIEAIQQFTFSDRGDIQLNIFITYKATEKKASTYVPYMVTLNLTETYLKEKSIKGSYGRVKTIKTFLVDTDPLSSRGTVTTVKNPTSGS